MSKPVTSTVLRPYKKTLESPAVNPIIMDEVIRQGKLGCCWSSLLAEGDVDMTAVIRYYLYGVRTDVPSRSVGISQKEKNGIIVHVQLEKSERNDFLKAVGAAGMNYMSVKSVLKSYARLQLLNSKFVPDRELRE